MRNISKIVFTLLAVSLFVLSAKAQEQTESLRDRLAKRQQQQQGAAAQDANLPKLSVRAEMLNQEQNVNLQNATWMRIVYRFLDLTKGSNAALFYPEQPIDNRMNLYTLTFKLLGSGSITAYDFNNGEAIFTDKHKVDFKNILENLEIPFQQNGTVFKYDEYSIPANEALGYYIKEVWYFDQSNSVLGVKVEAFCPVLFRQDYNITFSAENTAAAGERQPQYWIRYDDVRPYLALMPIMASDLNNVMNKSIDDYFRLRLYDGEIYKTANMQNKLLQEKYNAPETLKGAQDKIEGELKQFEKGLWIASDSTAVQDPSKKGKETSPKSPKTSSKPSQPKAPSAKKSPNYSARDRR